MNTRALVAAISAAVSLASASAAEDGSLTLFNGQNLDGWEGNPALWSVRDGAITGETKADTNLKHNTFLVWKGGTVDDFELRLRYRIVNGNSGIQYRSRVVEQGAQGPIVAGYQADFEAGKTYSGILYEERGRGILAQRGQMTRILTAEGGKHQVEVVASLGKTEDIQAGIKSEDWNDYLVIARGNRLTHAINGRVTADVTDDDASRAAKSGVLALQVHQGPPMTVQFKDVRLRKLTGGGAATASASDLDRMQGDWKAVAGVRDGEAISGDGLSGILLKIKGDKYGVTWSDGSDSGGIKLKPDATPKEIDIASDSSGPIQGIYDIRDGRMRIAYGIEGAGRPKDFEASAGASSVSITYQLK